MVAVYSLDIHNTSTASWATQLCSVFIESLLPTVLSHRDCEVVCVVSDGVNPAAFQNRLYWFFQQVQTVTAEIRTLLLLWSSEPSASDNWIYLFWQYKYMQLSFHVGLMGSVRSMSSLQSFCYWDNWSHLPILFISQQYFWGVLYNVLHVLRIFCLFVSCTLSSSGLILNLINWNILNYIRVLIQSMK